jgi:hypothetical protein
MAVALVPIASNADIASVNDGGTTTDLLYTSTSGPTQINQITVVNTSTTVIQLVTFWILPSGIAASAEDPIWAEVVPVSAGSGVHAWKIVSGLLGHVIPTGGTLKCSTTTASVVTVTASGVLSS